MRCAMKDEQYLKIAKNNFKTPFFMFIPLLLITLYWGKSLLPTASLLAIGLAFVLGVFLWSVFEYFLHRYLLHIDSRYKFLNMAFAGFHLLHHKMPQSKDFIASPVYFAIFGYALIFGIINLITQNFGWSLVIMSGLGAGYLAYEWIHFMAHHMHPKKGMLKYLKDYHLHHHFKNDQKNFGVTHPVFDFIFKTAAKK